MGRFLNLNERIDPLNFAAWLDKRPRPSTWHPSNAAPIVAPYNTVMCSLWRPNAEYGIMSTIKRTRATCNSRVHGQPIKEVIMGSIPRTSGIYQILCVSTGKVYIGSAVNLRQRWSDHRKTLRGNRHSNIHLQRAWDKYGEDAFEFSILESVMFVEHLIEREQAWIDARSPEFNIAPNAGSQLGIKYSPEYGAAVGERRSETYEGFIDPDGNEVTVHGLWGWCKRMGLAHSAMYRLFHGQGRTKSYKGWTHSNHPFVGRAQTWEGFIDPDGNIIEPIYNLSSFCRIHGLNESHMQAVWNGKRKHHRGWTVQR